MFTSIFQDNKISIYKNNFLLFSLTLIPFIYIENLFDIVDLPRSAFISFIASLWFLTWIINIKKNNFRINWNPLFIIIFFLLLFASLSTIWGKGNMLYQKDLYFYTSLVLICFMAMQTSIEALIKFIAVAIVTASICAIIGILQNFAFNPFEFVQIAPPAATFINKNFAANFFDLILPVAIMLFLLSNNRRMAWITAFIVATIAGYIILTKSRGSYISTVLALSILLFSIQIFPWLKQQVSHSSKLYKKQAIFIIAIPIVLSYLPLPNKSFQQDFDKKRFASLFSGTQQDAITTRLYAYNNALDLIKESPVLGVGLGGFQENFRPYLQSPLAEKKIFSDYIFLHNEPLQLFIELGLIGFISTLIFFALLFWFSYIQLKTTVKVKVEINDLQLKALQIGLLLATLSSLSHSLFSFPYHQPVPALFLALWVGFMLNLSAKEWFLSNFTKLGIIQKLVATFAILFFITTTYFYAKYFESSHYMLKSKYATNCNEASEFTFLSHAAYAKDYLNQSQGINIIGSCPLDTKKQLLFAESVLEKNPSHPLALYLASLSYFKLGYYDASYNSLKVLSLLYPYFSNAYVLLGHIAVKHKEYGNAKSHYTYALKLSPNNYEAKNLLQQIEQKGY